MYNENEIAGTLTSVVIEGGMGSSCWLDVWQSKVARHKRRVIQAELGADLGDEQAPVPVFCKQQYLGVKCVGQVGGNSTGVVFLNLKVAARRSIRNAAVFAGAGMNGGTAWKINDRR